MSNKPKVYAVKKGKKWWNRHEYQWWDKFSRACVFNRLKSAKQTRDKHGGDYIAIFRQYGKV